MAFRAWGRRANSPAFIMNAAGLPLNPGLLPQDARDRAVVT
jgi:hypothetical protein